MIGRVSVSLSEEQGPPMLAPLSRSLVAPLYYWLQSRPQSLLGFRLSEGPQRSHRTRNSHGVLRASRFAWRSTPALAGHQFESFSLSPKVLVPPPFAPLARTFQFEALAQAGPSLVCDLPHRFDCPLGSCVGHCHITSASQARSHPPHSSKACTRTAQSLPCPRALLGHSSHSAALVGQ
jgi:hypothetical protein